MPNAVEEILAFVNDKDALEQADDEIRAVQLKAIGERFEQRRTKIPLLQHRADEAGVNGIRSLQDVVPLLFSHGTYKSYPESFMDQGHWDRLLHWYDSLSAVSVIDTDVSDVQDADEFIARLYDAGHWALVSGGTSGKCSLLNHEASDWDFLTSYLANWIAWPDETPTSRVLFGCSAHLGNTRHAEWFRAEQRAFAKPGYAFGYDIEERATDFVRMGRMRRAMADGTATPGDIAAFERDAAERAEAAEAAVRQLAEKIVEFHDQPCIGLGNGGEWFRVLNVCKELGYEGGAFHPDSIFLGSGEFAKRVERPDELRAEVDAFLLPARYRPLYGMSELNTTVSACEAGNYHFWPWIVLLPLDETGEALTMPENGERVVARAAFFDLSLEGRWGGVISGDRVTVQSGRCACGRPGPVICPPIQRFANLNSGDDDKLGCAGSIDAYIRGYIGA